MLPLLGTPLLTWTLECLAAAGVARTYVFVNDGFDSVQAYLRSVLLFTSSTFFAPQPRIYNSRSPSMLKSMITLSMEIVLRSTSATTQGDVLREVDALGLAADFLLVRAGYIGNLHLAQLVKRFTQKRKKDPGLAMECLLAPYNPSVSRFA